jgi:hypothetical protein
MNAARSRSPMIKDLIGITPSSLLTLTARSEVTASVRFLCAVAPVATESLVISVVSSRRSVVMYRADTAL